jgi:hypothetical protein
MLDGEVYPGQEKVTAGNLIRRTGTRSSSGSTTTST